LRIHCKKQYEQQTKKQFLHSKILISDPLKKRPSTIELWDDVVQKDILALNLDRPANQGRKRYELILSD